MAASNALLTNRGSAQPEAKQIPTLTADSHLSIFLLIYKPPRRSGTARFIYVRSRNTGSCARTVRTSRRKLDRSFDIYFIYLREQLAICRVWTRFIF